MTIKQQQLKLSAKAKPNESIQQDGFKVLIRRSRRRKKSMSIQVKEGEAFISVPQRTAMAEIERLISQKDHWIRKQISKQQTAIEQSQKKYIDGEQFFYRGKPLTLLIETAQQPRAFIKGERLLLLTTRIGLSAVNQGELISKEFQRLAELHLKERTQFYANIINVSYNRIQVKSYKSRWGSCSTLGHISYNWRIIIAPDAVIDYIIVHELCHLIEHNHSIRFWKLVGQFSPHYKQQKKWLQHNGLRLTV